MKNTEDLIENEDLTLDLTKDFFEVDLTSSIDSSIVRTESESLCEPVNWDAIPTKSIDSIIVYTENSSLNEPVNLDVTLTSPIDSSTIYTKKRSLSEPTPRLINDENLLKGFFEVDLTSSTGLSTVGTENDSLRRLEVEKVNSLLRPLVMVNDVMYELKKKDFCTKKLNFQSMQGKIDNTDFSNSTFPKPLMIHNATLLKCDFSISTFNNNVTFLRSKLIRCDLNDIKLVTQKEKPLEVSFIRCILQNVTLRHSALADNAGTIFSECILGNVDFTGCDLSKTDFLQGCQFSQVNLRGAIVNWSKLESVECFSQDAEIDAALEAIRNFLANQFMLSSYESQSAVELFHQVNMAEISIAKDILATFLSSGTVKGIEKPTGFWTSRSSNANLKLAIAEVVKLSSDTSPTPSQ